MIARKSKSNAINSLIELGKKLGLEINENLDGTEINSPAIDKAYFTSLFNTDMETINELISESIDYGKIDNLLIDKLSEFIKSIKPDISENSIGLFINYIKSYIEKV